MAIIPMIARIPVLAFLSIMLQLSSLNALAASTTGSADDHNIPYKRTAEVETGTSIIRVVSGFVLVIAIGFGVILAIRRYMPASFGASTTSSSRNIDLLEMRRLAPRLTLYLLKIDGEKILLAQSSEALTMHRLHSSEKHDNSTE